MGASLFETVSFVQYVFLLPENCGLWSVDYFQVTGASLFETVSFVQYIFLLPENCGLWSVD